MPFRVGFLIIGVAACGGNASQPSITDAPVSDTATIDATPTACPAPFQLATATATELAITGDPGAALGIFDPSFVYPAEATGGAMSYSAVPTQETIRTRIAVSSDHGATWTYVAEPNVPEPAVLASSDPIECPGGTCSGNLTSEVTSLVYDADDPAPARRWKLFAHRYLVGAGVALHYRLGTITLQTAAQPQGPWSAPQKAIGWFSSSAYSSTGITTNINAFPQSADCLVLTEPAALWLPGSLHLAIGCIYLDGGTPKIRVELLRSTDHASTWARVSTLLRPDDARCLTPGASINGAELFVHAGKLYASASPSDDGGYHGCLVYPIADLVAGTIERRDDGAPVVTRTIVTDPAMFAGACGFAEGAGGFAMDVGFFGQARPFRILRSGVTMPTATSSRDVR